jgi:phosphatidate cytidylyltransferase
MVVKRIITGLIIGFVVGCIVWFGEPWITAAVCLVAVLAMVEFYRIVRTEHIQPLTYFGIMLGLLLILNIHIPPNNFTLPLLLVLATVVPLIWMLFRRNKDHAFINWGWTLAGILYIAWLLSFYVAMRSLGNGIWWVFMVLASTALCDVFAYAVGSLIGKHAVASSVSPGKTWEGCAGGMAASIIVAVTLSFWFQLPLQWWQMVVAGVVIGTFSQVGDMVESLLKRNMKTKDTGNLLPGHGGILDRIDSHLLIAPIAYYLIILATNIGWLAR